MILVFLILVALFHKGDEEFKLDKNFKTIIIVLSLLQWLLQELSLQAHGIILLTNLMRGI